MKQPNCDSEGDSLVDVKILSSDDKMIWDAFVATHPCASIYHTSLWQQVLLEAFKHRPFYLVLQNDDQTIVGGVPVFTVKSKITGNRLASLPVTQYCNPLVSSPDELDALIKFAMDHIKEQKIEYMELRTSQHLEQNNGKFGDVLDEFSCYILELDDDLESIKRKLHKSCIQRKIKKSNKLGIELVIGDSIKDVKIFYNLYMKMRKYYGVLPPPYKFFKVMWEIMSKNKYIEILHAKYKDQYISSILLLKYKDTVIYEYGASSFDMMQLSPSIFLLWEGIKRSKLAGYKKFDFGRTSETNEGLRQFKMRWNTKREKLYYYFIPEMKGFGSIKHQGLAKQVLYYSIKYSPESLCQLMSRTLFKSLV